MSGKEKNISVKIQKGESVSSVYDASWHESSPAMNNILVIGFPHPCTKIQLGT